MVNLFAHGLADFSHQATIYEKFFGVSFESFNFPDVQDGGFDRKKSSLGQDGDMAAAREFYGQFDGKLKHKFGLSRGAVTIINCAAEDGAEAEDGTDEEPRTVETVALTVESPFADMRHVIASALETGIGRAARIPGLVGFVHLFLPLIYGQYKSSGIQPIHVVHKIRKDMPILLICSKQDQLIPWWSTMALYKRLKETGHEHVYILVVDRGRHAKILLGPDGDIYVKVFHAFSRRYGLQHDPLLAQEGQERLDLCQPDLDTVTSVLPSWC
ncbi:prolyl oligopeptidase family serine peptidase [Candidatus Dependentiae bacterium]